MTAKKKVEKVVDDYLDGELTPEEAVTAFKAASDDDAAPPPLKVVKPAPKPGTKEFDWQAEYPGEECYVFTSSDGLTIGLTRLGPHRKPKPGLLRRLHREGGMSVMWYFIELASSPTSLKVQEELEEEDYTKMLRGWAEFAGIELSE
jgi:hypothetical protein